MDTTTVLTGQLAWCWHHSRAKEAARAAALAARRRPHPAHRSPRRRRPVGHAPSASPATPAGSAPARRSGRCTPTRPPSSAASARCSCRPCTRRCWPASTSTPTTRRTRRAGCSAPPRSSPSPRSVRRRRPRPPATGYAGRTHPSAAAPPTATRTTPVTPSCSAGCTSRWPTRSRWRSSGSAAPGSTSTTTSPTWRSWGSGSGRRTCRATGPGWPPRGTTTCRSSPSPRPPPRRTPSCSTRRCRPGSGCPTGWSPRPRPPRCRRSCAGCSPAGRCCPTLPARLVGRAATRLLAAVLGESPAARAAHRRTRPVGTVRG